MRACACVCMCVCVRPWLLTQKNVLSFLPRFCKSHRGCGFPGCAVLTLVSGGSALRPGHNPRLLALKHCPGWPQKHGRLCHHGLPPFPQRSILLPGGWLFPSGCRGTLGTLRPAGFSSPPPLRWQSYTHSPAAAIIVGHHEEQGLRRGTLNELCHRFRVICRVRASQF